MFHRVLSCDKSIASGVFSRFTAVVALFDKDVYRNIRPFYLIYINGVNVRFLYVSGEAVAPDEYLWLIPPKKHRLDMTKIGILESDLKPRTPAVIFQETL